MLLQLQLRNSLLQLFCQDSLPRHHSPGPPATPCGRPFSDSTSPCCSFCSSCSSLSRELLDSTA
jgi:hypothetical protein